MNFFLKITSKPNYPFFFSDTNSLNGSLIAIGKYISSPPSTPLLYEDSGNSNLDIKSLQNYDVLETVGGGWVISERFKILLETNFEDEVQLFPTLINYKNENIKNYFAINIYNKIECYDLEKSVYTKHPVDQSYDFTKKVLKTNPLEEYGMEYNIVRNIFDNQIVVSEFFKEIFTKNDINSLKFTKK